MLGRRAPCWARAAFEMTTDWSQHVADVVDAAFGAFDVPVTLVRRADAGAAPDPGTGLRPAGAPGSEITRVVAAIRLPDTVESQGGSGGGSGGKNHRVRVFDIQLDQIDDITPNGPPGMDTGYRWFVRAEEGAGLAGEDEYAVASATLEQDGQVVRVTCVREL